MMHHLKLMLDRRIIEFGNMPTELAKVWLCLKPLSLQQIDKEPENELQMLGKLVCIASLGIGVVDKSLLDLKLHNARHFVMCTLSLMRFKLIEKDMTVVQGRTRQQSCVPCTPHPMTHELQLWYIGQEALDLEAA
jgi:hypothetical protein